MLEFFIMPGLVLFATLVGGSVVYVEEIRTFTIKRRKLIRAVAIIIGIALYLNIGWAYGTYSAMHLGDGMSQTTVLQKFLIGPGKFFANGPNPNLSILQNMYMFFWLPFLLATIIAWATWLLIASVAWTSWLVLWLVSGLWQATVFVFWLVFAGGIAKLLGVG